MDTDKKIVMGILNVTPDSFYDGGKYNSFDSAIKHAEQMIAEGADIIDLGGASSRPFSDEVPYETERERIIPIIKHLKKHINLKLSIDTFRYEIAKEALDLGADIINDIFGISYSSEMAKLIAEYNVPIIIMHTSNKPKTMQINPTYSDVITEIMEYFRKEISFANLHGIKNNNIILDPGIGFGKRLEDNLEIISNISEFLHLGLPILIGISRKSFIGKVLDDVSVKDRLIGSLLYGFVALIKGSTILRVHDVKETVQMLKIYETIKKNFSMNNSTGKSKI